MENKQCKYCNQIFEINESHSSRWFSNHVRWCDKNPKSKNIENIKLANKKVFDDKFGDFRLFEVSCFKCNCKFTVEEREKLYPQREKYFCGLSCANSHVVSDETKEKIRLKFSKIYLTVNQTRICVECDKTFEVLSNSKKRFCSRKCGSASRKLSTEYLTYKNACKFKFNVWSYPDKFDLNLIYKHGWYKAKNRGDNLTGVSRDHRISISFGWDNNIDPKIMSHPANCKLMTHNENVSKHKKCSLLLEELIKEIENWDNDNK